MARTESTPSKEKIRRFALAYMRTGSQAKAYRAAVGPHCKATMETAKAEGWKLSQDPRAQALIAKLRAEAAERAKTDLAEWVHNELKLARADMANLFDEDGRLLPLSEMDPDARAAIQSIDIEEEQVERVKDGKTEITVRTRVKKIRLHSKDGSQERLGKHLGAYKSDNDQKRVPYEEALRALHGLPDAG